MTMMFDTSGPRPDVRFQEFSTEQSCKDAANWIATDMKYEISNSSYASSSNVQFHVQCKKK